MKNIALFDMDGTICDYMGAMNVELMKLRSPDEKFVDPFLIDDDPKYQYLWNRMNLIKSNEDWWANLPKFSLGLEVMEMAKALGYHCEILTQAPKKNPAALAGKHRWLLANLDEDIDFTMTRNKGRYYGRVLVDDYPLYVESWLEHRPRGLVIMPANMYNEDFSHSRVIRYTGENKDEILEGLNRTFRE
ncbi:hypothetical protein GOV12_06925 [Candidatus Pacearchaeota archaeon]|nr:hypothetical protein [Candidatus Pacearchaeota archaeon]